MLPAVWNKFPFIFSDSGIYLDAAIKRFIPGDRSVFYSLFIFPLHWKISLWPVVVAQAVVTFYMLRVFFKAFSKRFSEYQVVLTTLLLSLFSSLPWFVGQIMPDLFCALVILAIVTAMLGHHRISPLDRIALPVLVCLFITTHLSYLLVAAGTFCFTVLLQLLGRSPGTLGARALSRANVFMATAMVASVVMMLSINVVAKKGLTFASSGNVMLMAKVLDQGIGLDYLTHTCPVKPLPICSILSKLKEIKATAEAKNRPIGNVSDNFLWGGPLASLGGMEEVSSYASEITHGSISAYPGRFVHEGLRGFLAQTVKFQLGDDLYRYGPETGIYQVINERFAAGNIEGLLASRQYEGSLYIDQFRIVSSLFLAVCVAVIVVFMVRRWRSEFVLVHAILIMLVGVILNDMVTGSLSAVHDRYGSRVIWLFALMGIFIATEFIKDRKAGGARLSTSSNI